MLRLITSAELLVSAIAFDGVDNKAPAEIVFLPEGTHRITPLSQKNGITINIPAERGEAIAAALNADLQKRMGEQVKPWIDFEHSRKFPASGYPTSLRYEKGKGIMAAMDWSKSGRDAVEGRDVRYFSPEFYVNDDGIPSGLPPKGPIGGLVTEPAFREIGAIAASESQQKQQTTMSELVFAALSISASAENAEADAVSKIEALKADVSAKQETITELEAKVTATEAKEAEARKERAESLVQAAIDDGRIAPKDEETIKGFSEKITAGDAFAEAMLGKLPKLADPTEKIITGSGNHHNASNETRITAAQAKARAELGSEATFQHVWARAAEIDPKAFEA